MNKILIAFALILFSNNIALSKVSFITDPQSGDSSFSSIKAGQPKPGEDEHTTEFRCTTMGYYRTICRKGFYLTDRCPLNSKYYKTCCSNDYNMTKEECERSGGIASSITCGGKYFCDL